MIRVRYRSIRTAAIAAIAILSGVAVARAQRAPCSSPTRRRMRRAARRCTTRTASSATGRRAKATAPRPRCSTAAARLHIGEVQDPHDRNRQPADRRRPDGIGVRRAVRLRDARLERHPAGQRHPRRRRATSKSLSPRFASETPKAVALGPAVPSVAGKHRARPAVSTRSCSAPHATAPTGAAPAPSRPKFEDDWRQPLRAADLTEPWTFHGGATSRDVYLRFRTGMTGTPMPSFVGTASDADMWDLANYVVSLGRKPVWSMTRTRSRGVSRARRTLKRRPIR